MNRVHAVEDTPIDQMGAVAVSVGFTAPNQLHVGVLHRTGTDPGAAPTIQFLHLEDDRVLTNGEPLPGFLWVDPNIHRRRLPQVATICRLVWGANQSGGIPYGFGPPSDCLDEETGEYLIGPLNWGLTCATFVLAVFHRAGLSLASYASWPIREADQKWQAKVLEILRKRVSDPDRIPKLDEVVGKAVRYRPEEVAAAATVSPRPADFSIAEERGKAIRARLLPDQQPGQSGQTQPAQQTVTPEEGGD